MKKPKPDFQIYGGGTLYMLRPVSEMGEGWVKDNLPGDALTFGGAIAVEHRYITVTFYIACGLPVPFGTQNDDGRLALNTPERRDQERYFGEGQEQEDDDIPVFFKPQAD